MTKISVIIPVYNTEKYIEECLESVVNSTVFNICEVIVIDDGSIDSSVQIIEKYEKAYKNIKQYHFENAGLSVSRNRGLELARGEYIFFLDSDDILENNYIENLYNAAKENSCQAVFAGFTRYYSKENKKEPFFRESLSTKKVMSGTQYLEKRMDTEDWEHEVWSAIYTRKFLIQSKLSFCKDIRVYEDILFTNELLLKAKSVYMIPEYGYLYRQLDKSLSHGGMTDFDIDNLISILEYFVKNYPIYSAEQKHAIGRVYYQLLSMILFCIGNIHSKKEKEYYKRLDMLKLYKPMVKSAVTTKEKVKLIIFMMDWGLFFKLKNRHAQENGNSAEKDFEPKVSVIVPCYNSKRTVRECLDSILNNGYNNIEIIAVDDGSTDNTVEILNEYAQKDERVKVLPCGFIGVSQARNEALKMVSGEYIQFADSDDTVAKNSTKSLVNAASSGADLVIAGFSQIDTKTQEEMYHRFLNNKSFNIKDFIKELAKDPGAHYYGVLWNKLYKAYIIKKNNIIFNPKLSMGEDFVFNTLYYSNIKSVKAIEEKVYRYNWGNSNSLSNSTKTVDERIDERLSMYFAYRDMYKSLSLGGIWNLKLHFYIMRCYFNEFDFFNNDESLKDKLYKRYISDNKIPSIEFKAYSLLRKLKEFFRKMR